MVSVLRHHEEERHVLGVVRLDRVIVEQHQGQQVVQRQDARKRRKGRKNLE